MNVIAPVEKFADYIFKPGATHGKDRVFRSLGYSRSDSQTLSEQYSLQAAARYAVQDFTQGKSDEYGQRLNIEIEIAGIGDKVGQISYLISGWMIKDDGSIALNTPFAGFAR